MEEAPFVSAEHARKENARARSAAINATAAQPAAAAARSTYSWFGSKPTALAAGDKRSFSL